MFVQYLPTQCGGMHVFEYLPENWHQMVSCVSLNLLAILFFETLLTEP